MQEEIRPTTIFLLVLNDLVLFITRCPSSILGLGFIRYKETTSAGLQSRNDQVQWPSSHPGYIYIESISAISHMVNNHILPKQTNRDSLIMSSNASINHFEE